MTQPEIFKYLGQLADGGTYPAIRPEIIGSWQILIPDQHGIVDTFHQICSSIFEHAENNRLESHTLAGIRDALLPKLLSGEICVKDAEKFVESIG